PFRVDARHVLPAHRAGRSSGAPLGRPGRGGPRRPGERRLPQPARGGRPRRGPGGTDQAVSRSAGCPAAVLLRRQPSEGRGAERRADRRARVRLSLTARTGPLWSGVRVHQAVESFATLTGKRRAMAIRARAATNPTANAPAIPVRSWLPVESAIAMHAPPRPVPIPAPRVSVSRIDESWLASAPPDAWLIAARGMVGNVTPIPRPARAHPMYGTTMGSDVRPAVTPMMPSATTAVPPATRAGAPIRPIVRDCHHLPKDQAPVASFTTMPASATDNPMT